MMKLLPLFLFLGTMCWSANWAISLSAQTVYVRQGATGANDGSSWTNAFTDLQAAIDAAPADSELWIATGAYHPGEKINPSASTNHSICMVASAEVRLHWKTVIRRITLPCSAEIIWEMTPQMI